MDQKIEFDLRDRVSTNSALAQIGAPVDAVFSCAGVADGTARLTFGADYREAAGVKVLAPEQVAHAMAFLCAPAASGICGTTLLVDWGQVGAGITGSFESPIIKILAGVS